MNTTLSLPPLHRSADLLPGSLDDASRTVDVVWSTGARVRRHPLFGDPFDEELSLDPAHVRLERLNAGAPFLKVHRADALEAVLGSVVPGSARIEAGQGVATIRFSEREDVAALWSDIKAGHLRAVSIGYQVHRFEVSHPDGAAEVWRAVDWTPFEISAVPVGADPAAGFRQIDQSSPCHVVRRSQPPSNSPSSHSRSPLMTTVPRSQDTTVCSPHEDDPMTVDTEPRSESRQSAVEEHDTAVSTEEGTQGQQEPHDPVARSLPEDQTRRIQAEERQRVATISDLAERLNLGRDMASDLIRRGVSLDEARCTMLDALAEASDRTQVSSQVAVPLGGQDEHTTRREAIQAALLHRFDPGRYGLSEPARAYRSLSLIELSRDYLTATGERVRGLSRDEVASRALHSTSDFPEILAAVTHKTLRDAYQEAPRTFLPIARRATASDFKEIQRLQLGEAPMLEKVNEAGEFRHGTVGEGRERYRLETWGKIFAITRQVIINDDLDAFTRIPALFGNAAARLENDLVWSIFTDNPAMADGQTLFHNSHKNLAGTGAELGVSALGKARAAMARQTGVDGKTVLNIRPSFLVVPVTLELAAEQLVAQNLVPAQSGHVVPQSIRSLAVIAEPRLDPASGAVPWYLVASPSTIDTIEYAHLEGQEGVYIETRNGFEVDGVSIKARLDFGVKAIDWRGIYKNPGVTVT